MKIISIDVGIKNLAFCVLQYNNGNITITNWNSINICENKEKICKEIKKKDKTECLKKAKYFKNNKYYCKIHAKNSEFLIPTVEINTLLKKLHKNKISKKDLKMYMERFLPELDKKMEKSIAVGKLLEYLEKTYLDSVSKTNINKLNMIECGIMLKNHLDKHFTNDVFDKILIENQIGPLALRMKMMQGMIMQHFIEKGQKNIEFINASNKLKDFIQKKVSYSERKKKSIEITRNILIENNLLNSWLEHFNKHSKKDDLADSYLQAHWYIKHKL
jgi:hypothetical protein